MVVVLAISSGAVSTLLDFMQNVMDGCTLPTHSSRSSRAVVLRGSEAVSEEAPGAADALLTSILRPKPAEVIALA